MELETAERKGQRLGHYTLTGEAGRGGMSVVYEATDERMGRRVALKAVTLPANFSSKQRDEMIARLRREARSIARLSHPNVVSVYDVGEEGGTHYVVMEFLEGRTLRERLTDGPLTPDEAVRLLDQVAGALDAVHAEGVVHRDIKPSNIMLLPDGRVKLMDFGVARQIDDTLLTQAGMMVGSPAYMAPEIINGDDATRASDIWSLGVLLYQALTGRPPFDSKNIPTVLYRVTHADPEPISGLPARAQSVLARALQKEPARRYSSATELAAAFRAALAPSQNLPAPPAVSRPALRARPARRPWAPLLAGLLLLLAAVGAAFWGHRLGSGPPGAVGTAAISHAPPHIASAPGRNAPIAPNVHRPRVRVAALRQERHRPVRVIALRRPEERHRRKTIAPAPAYAAAPRPVRARPQAETVAVTSRQVRPRLRRPVMAGLPPAAPPRRARRTLLARTPLPQQPNAPNKPNLPNPPSASSAEVSSSPPPARSPVAPAPAAAPATTAPTRTARNLSGTWHGWQGIHSHDPAVLTIRHSGGSAFDGVMTVRTPEHATVRVALTGHVAPDGGVTMRETRILSSTKPHAWDLGFKSGRLGVGGQMRGTDHDVRGRSAQWSFTR